MRLSRLVLLTSSMLGLAAAARGPVTTKPASAPTSGPSVDVSALDVSLNNGAVRFAPPDGWNVVAKSDNGLLITYAAPDKSGFITVGVSPQEVALTDDLKQPMAQKIGKGIRDQFEKDGREVLLPPKVEKDDRFFLRIHDRSRGADRRVADRVQMYRVMGLNLMMVAATAWSEKPDVVESVHKAGEDLILDAHLGRTAPAAKTSSGNPKKTPPPKVNKPTSFQKARIKINPPALWNEEKSDAASGVVATYRDPEHDSDLIVVSVHPIPKELKKDPKARAAVIDEIIAGPDDSVKGLGKIVGKPEVSEEPGFLKKTVSTYETADGTKTKLASRLVLVGDTVVRVTSLASEDDAESVRQVGDKLATEITPIGK